MAAKLDLTVGQAGVRLIPWKVQRTQFLSFKKFKGTEDFRALTALAENQFSAQHLRGGSKPPKTKVPRDPLPFSDHLGHCMPLV